MSKIGKHIAMLSLVAISSIAGTTSEKSVSLDKFRDFFIFKDQNVHLVKAIDRGNLYQLQVNARGNNFKAFVTKDLKSVIIGEGFDVKTGKKLIIKKDMTKYQKISAFKYGNGKDIYYLFTDPECPFCKRFEEQLPYLKDNATFYVFLMPLTSIHPHSEKMSKYILSLPKDKRWDALERISVKSSDEYIKIDNMKYSDVSKADKELKKMVSLANELGVRGTPTLYDENGESVSWNTLAPKYNAKVPVDINGIKYLIKQKLALQFGDKTKPPVYIFTDTECPFCQKEFKSGSMKKLMEHYSVNVFLMPLIKIHKKALEETVYILSRKTDEEKKKAFKTLMSGKDLTVEQKKEINKILKDKMSPISKKISTLLFIARKLNIKGTPTIVDENGNIVTSKDLLKNKK